MSLLHLAPWTPSLGVFGFSITPLTGGVGYIKLILGVIWLSGYLALEFSQKWSVEVNHIQSIHII